MPRGCRRTREREHNWGGSGGQLDQRFEELALVKAGILDVQVELEAIDRFQCTIDVAMPQEPLQPLQFVEYGPLCVYARLGVSRARSPLANWLMTVIRIAMW